MDTNNNNNPDEFTKMLIRNDQEEESSWLYANGKKPNVMCPIFWFKDVGEEAVKDYMERSLRSRYPNV